MVSGDSSGGVTTVSGLIKEIVYTVEVAVATSSGSGNYSDSFTFETPGGEYIIDLMVTFSCLYITPTQMSSSV